MTRINCTFPIYVLPQDANWAVTLLKFVSEQFGFSVLREEKEFTINADHPDLFLYPRVVVDVEGQALGRTEPAKFLVTTWALRVNNDGTEIELKLRELRPSPLDAWFARLPVGTQKVIVWTIAAASLCVFTFSGLALAHYPEPLAFWAWVGRNIRDIVALGLLLLAWLPYFWAADRLENAPLVKRILFVLCLVVSIAAVVGWGVSVEALEPSASSEASIEYLNNLKCRAATLIPMIVSLIPWLLIIVKRLGLDVLALVLKAMKESLGTP